MTNKALIYPITHIITKVMDGHWRSIDVLTIIGSLNIDDGRALIAHNDIRSINIAINLIVGNDIAAKILNNKYKDILLNIT